MRTRWLAVGAAATVAVGGLALPGLAGAAPGAASTGNRLSGGRPGAVNPAPAAAAISRSETLFVVFRNPREHYVDIDGSRTRTPGDYWLLEEQLFDRGGARLGSSSVHCAVNLTTIRCQATLAIRGRGALELAHTFAGPDSRGAVVGGTGAFRKARGQATVVRLDPYTARIDLLP